MRCLHRLGAVLGLVAIIFAIGYGNAATGATTSPTWTASLAGSGTPKIDWP
ncbi:hypothetical protein [Streptomyces sp. YIM S03343]